MKLLLLGPPGAGKGTQGELLAGKLGLPHLSAGDLLRAKATDGTAEGREIATYLRRGDLVPDELIFDVMVPVLVEAAERGGFILDGFPRTVQQAEAAADRARRLGLTPDAVVYLHAPDEVLEQRLLGRVGRDDDTADVIRHRLEVFDQLTRPLITRYRDRGILVAVDADQPAEVVTDEILRRLREVVPE
jgi:adenylate kinase